MGRLTVRHPKGPFLFTGFDGASPNYQTTRLHVLSWGCPRAIDPCTSLLGGCKLDEVFLGRRSV